MPDRAVTADEADIRLDRWVRRHFPGLPQSAIQKLCRTGRLRVDGARVETATRLAPGQTVRVPAVPDPPRAPPPPPDPDAARALRSRLLYEDEHLIVLDKPYGLPVQGGPGIVRHLDSLAASLAANGHAPRLVHRLDRDTTGVLVMARTPGSAARLAAAFRGRTVDKTYWAVVAGRPVPVEGIVDMPLRRAAGPRGERTEPAARDDREAARAVTEYRTLDHAARKLAWLELKPVTGRTHQLRVHCVALRAPILGDVKYAEPDQNNAFAATVAGLRTELHLHARRLALPHPTGYTLTVEAPLPPHMRETFKTLGFTAPDPAPPTKRRGS